MAGTDRTAVVQEVLGYRGALHRAGLDAGAVELSGDRDDQVVLDYDVYAGGETAFGRVYSA